MHRAAVWQHSSKLKIKIVQNSTEHFLWTPSDFFSDDVLSCLQIFFTNSVFQVPPLKIVSRIGILGIRWPGLSVWCEMSMSHGKLCLRYSSVLFEKWDYPQEYLFVIRDEKVSPFMKFEIIVPLLCFLLDPLTNRHCIAWSSMIIYG